MKKQVILTFLVLFLVTFVSANNFGYNYLEQGETVIEGENYTINTNYSDDSGALEGRDTSTLGDYFQSFYGWLTGNIFDQNLNTTEKVNFTQLNIKPAGFEDKGLTLQGEVRDYQGEVPDDVSGLFAWYDFTDESSLTLDADNNITGADNLQGSANYDIIPKSGSNPPTWVSSGGLNDLGYADFDNTNSEAVTFYNNNKPFYDAIGAGKEYTIFIVVYNKNAGYCAGSLFGSTKSNLGQGNFLAFYWSSIALRLGSGDYSYTSNALSYNTWYVINSKGEVGDIDLKTGLTTLKTLTEFNRDNWLESIGRTNDAQCNSPVPASFGYLGARISEIILYNTKLDDDDYEKVMAYIEDKYGEDYSSMVYHSQQEDYVDVKLSDDSTLFKIDKTGKVETIGDMEVDGDIIGNKGLSVAVTPINLAGAVNPIFSIDGSANPGWVFDLYDKSPSFSVFKVRNSARTHMQLTADIGRSQLMINPEWSAGAAFTLLSYSNDEGATMILRDSSITNWFGLGIGNTFFTDTAYKQLSSAFYEPYQQYQIIVQDRPLFIENSSSLMLGYNGTNWHNITFTETDLTIETTNLTIEGNLNVSGCIHYNGGVLGTCI